ncbi:MAG: sigma 54-interacting transcriptional regulator [Mailhella sp.]|nr:sigma 54-interacting transcriptional regulator [Mailhella sp.]
MSRIYFAWVGSTDVRGCAGTGQDGNPGPICAALREHGRSFDKMLLLYNDSVWAGCSAEDYFAWITAETGCRPVGEPAGDVGPYDFAPVYDFTKKVVRRAAGGADRAELFFHASPGTATMAMVWALLAGPYKATLIVSSETTGVRFIAEPGMRPADLLSDGELERTSEAKAPHRMAISPAFEGILFRSEGMRKAVERAQIAAPRNINVLIQGETGTGKELFARAIHAASGRKGKFVAVNCGALPADLIESELFGHTSQAFTGARKARKGYFREADGGTIFLDEIAELPRAAQTSLLRVLQERQVVPVGSETPVQIDARVISAGNRELFKETVQNRFRSDLYYRLAVAEIILPPLRERKDDIPLLLDDALRKANCEVWGSETGQYRAMSDDALSMFTAYQWPGNVRELYAAIMRTVLWSVQKTMDGETAREALRMHQLEAAGEDCLPESGFSLENVLQATEKHYLELAHAQSGGSLKKGAEMLGIVNYQTYCNRLKKYGIR